MSKTLTYFFISVLFIFTVAEYCIDIGDPDIYTASAHRAIMLRDLTNEMKSMPMIVLPDLDKAHRRELKEQEDAVYRGVLRAMKEIKS